MEHFNPIAAYYVLALNAWAHGAGIVDEKIYCGAVSLSYLLLAIMH